MQRTVCSGTDALSYELERKRVKNINLRVHRDGTVHVSAPERMPLREIDAFVLRAGTFVERARARLSPVLQLPPRRVEDGAPVWLLGQELLLAFRTAARDDVREEPGRLVLYLRAPEPQRAERLLEKYCNCRAQDVFSALLQKHYPAFARRGAAEPALRIRTMRARWGSCQPETATITLNRRLVEAPERCIAYVVVHELCHLLVPDHSARFYALLAEEMPDWHARKQELNQCAAARP